MATAGTPQRLPTSYEISPSLYFILSLIITSHGYVHNFTTAHNTSGDLETAPSFILRESNDIEGIKSVLALFIVIDGGDGGLALGDVAVVVGINRATALGLYPRVEG